jgi:hypothetical protein
MRTGDDEHDDEEEESVMMRHGTMGDKGQTQTDRQDMLGVIWLYGPPVFLFLQLMGYSRGM